MMDISEDRNPKAKTGHKLNQVLKRLMTECEIDDAKLAKETRVPLTTIARMRACQTANPTASSLRPLSQYFGISISQLLGDEPLPIDHAAGNKEAASTKVSRVPLISWKHARSWTSSKSLPKHDIKGWITSDLPLSPMSYALTIENNAYGHIFRPNTVLIVDPSIPPTSTDFVVIQAGDEDNVILKEIIFDGEDIYLKSVNPELTRTLLLKEPYNYCGVVMESRYIHHEHNPAKVESVAKKLISSVSQPEAEIA